MQVGKNFFLKFLGGYNQQYKIPVYQRNYDWQPEHCKKLVGDIFDSAAKGKEHFTGSIVYLNENGTSSRRVSLIIDGQQRITTMMILLKIVSIMAKSDSFQLDQVSNNIENSLISFSDEITGDKHLRLVPVEDDRTDFSLLMANDIQGINSSKNIYKNFMIMKTMLEERIHTKEQFLSFYGGLSKLMIAEMSLDSGVDDPQEIFESINSTGLELSNADLIRNFLLMSAIEQDKLYNQYWKPLYKKIGSDKIEDFFLDFLLYKYQRSINYKQIYPAFVDLVRGKDVAREDILKELTSVGELYNPFIHWDDNYSQSTNEYLTQFRSLKQTTIFPFLINIFMDYRTGLFDEVELGKILKFLITYHIKRIVCGINSNSLRGLYINLYNRIFKVEENKRRYYDSVATYLSSLSSKDAIPGDELVCSSLQTIDLYHIADFCFFILDKIENSSKEKLVTEGMSIEHIMPQTLESSWRKMLGENHTDIHEKWVHTLGNLSLTGYNSDMNNHAFEEKKKTLKSFSKAVILNSDVIDKERWTEAEIGARAKRLANVVMESLKVDSFSQKGLRFENVIENDWTTEYNDIIGHKLYSYKFMNMDVEVKQESYISMLIEVINYLDQLDSKIMDDIAAKVFNPWNEGAKDYLHSDPKGMINPYKIRDNLFIDCCFNAPGCVYSIRKLMTYYNNTTEDKFLFYTKDKASK